MKKYLLLQMTPILLVSMLNVSLISCSNNNEEDESPKIDEKRDNLSEKRDNLSEKQRMFVGFWHTEGNSTDFLFKADGTCISYTFGTREDTEIRHGDWQYNENTKMLTTTIGSFQWSITMSTNQSWAGISLGGDGAQSYNHSDLWHFYVNLINGSWVSSKGRILDFNNDYGLRFYEVTDDNICYEITYNTNPYWLLVSSERDKIAERYGDDFYGIENVKQKISNVNGNSANVTQSYHYSYAKYNGRRYTTAYETEIFFDGKLTISELDSNDAILRVEGTTYSGEKIGSS